MSRPEPIDLKNPLRLLIVEDRDDDALLLLRELERGGYAVRYERVDTTDAFTRALANEDWHLVVSDFSLPTMTAHDVLKVLASRSSDIPCIIVSGTIREEAAVDLLRAGARDFVVKERLARLLPAIGRELREATERQRRREAERSLRDMRERMQFVLEAVGIGTWESDIPSGRVTWSDVLERLHGLEPGTFGGTTDAFLDTVHPDDRHELLRHLRQANREGKDFRIEYRTRWPDGSVHWMVGIGRTFCDDVGAPTRAVGVGMEITAQKHLEEQFVQAQKMESIGNLAGGIAHDFNNLLTVIVGCGDIVAERMVSDPVAADLLDDIRGAALSATALTRQLLTFSRRQIVVPRVMDLNEVITAFRKILRRLVEESVRIDVRLAPRLPPVRVDPGQVEQMLLNLLANARDAMPDGGTVTIETRHRILDADDSAAYPEVPPGAYVMLVVADTGSGMPPEVKARLFEPFFTTKPRDRGTGLGLATVYGIVQQSGGHIVVQSELDVGTTFSIYLPVVSAAKESGVGDLKDGADELRGTETIMVVEDNPSLRRLNERILRRYGYNVLMAADGEQAKQVYAAHEGPIHVVIIDVVMPGHSGPMVGAWIARQRPDAKIIYVSGYAGETIGDHRVLPPDSVFLQKPFTAAELAGAVRHVLALPRRRGAS